jgi:hypothetical protein
MFESCLALYICLQSILGMFQGVWPCGICLEDVPGSQCIHPAPCSHFYCKTCVAGMCASALEEKAVDRLVCPQPDCRAVMLPQVCGSLSLACLSLLPLSLSVSLYPSLSPPLSLCLSPSLSLSVCVCVGGCVGVCVSVCLCTRARVCLCGFLAFLYCYSSCLCLLHPHVRVHCRG